MIPIVSIVGKSDSGKTTLLEKVVRELKVRGYRVATIKHDAHSFEIDHEGKDSWRHKRAGADVTIFRLPLNSHLSPTRITTTPWRKSEIGYIQGVDIVISEGYKREVHPKIEVFRSEFHREMLCTDDDNLIAIAGDPPTPPEGVPVFGLDDPAGLCDFIVGLFFKAS